MKDALKLFRKYLPPYKAYVVLTFVFNFLMAIFSIFSVISLIPVLKILFKLEEQAYSYMEVDFSIFPLKLPSDAIINNMYAWLSEKIMDIGEVKTLFLIGLLGILMVALKTGFTYLSSFSMTKIRNHVVKDIRDFMIVKIISLPIGFFTEEKKGDIISRATSDVKEVEDSVMNSFDILFKNPMLVLFTIIAMLLLSWQLTLFVFIVFPIAGGIIAIIGKTLRKQSRKGQSKMGEILSTIEETLGGLRIIKAFNAEDKIIKKQGNQNEEYRKIMDKLVLRRALASPLSELLGTMLIIGVLYYGGTLILSDSKNSSLDAAVFIGYIGLFYTIINPTKGFATAYYNIQKGMAAMDRIEKILGAKSNIIQAKNPISISDINENITYNNISFKYQEDYVLNGVSIRVPKGQTIALVGQSGSGKSTMVDLLPRFYDVNKGNISIDGIDIKELEITKLRNLLGIVNQEPILFNDTIANNIAFGVQNATQEEIEQAARVANAHDFILETENGYETNIGDRGTRLSGGQRQRISIARAILTNPPIMILDEATSALDTESEQLVQEAITNLMKDRTSIVIAHRLSTIRNADNIYVLRAGKIIESGNYEELLKQEGEFKKLHDIQFS